MSTSVKTKYQNYFFGLLMFSFLVAPLGVKAAPSPTTLIPGEKGTGITYECGSGETAGECDWNDLIMAVKRAIDYGVTIALSISVVVIAWAGYSYMMSVDNPGKRKEANEMLWKVVVGIFFILAAWLMVSLITDKLLTDEVKQVVPLGQ